MTIEFVQVPPLWELEVRGNDVVLGSIWCDTGDNWFFMDDQERMLKGKDIDTLKRDIRRLYS